MSLIVYISFLCKMEYQKKATDELEKNFAVQAACSKDDFVKT